jgi:hypothetical protein
MGEHLSRVTPNYSRRDGTEPVVMVQPAEARSSDDAKALEGRLSPYSPAVPRPVHCIHENAPLREMMR